MLDDLKYIHEKDAQDALGLAAHQADQLRTVFSVPDQQFPVENIVFAGMGGSALAALISQSWPGYSLPFEICRSYTIPKYVSSKTLFIASSYSGDTEETLAALEAAIAAGAHIAVIATGGRLATIAQEKQYPFVQLPSGMQPRLAVLHSFKALVTLLESAHLVAHDQADAAIVQTADFLQNAIQAWLPEVPAARNPAKQLAQELMGKSPVIYAGPLLWPAAYKWKISCNENAKNVAWANQFSEFNHNEFLGWSSHPVDKPYAIIQLQSHLEHERIQKRFSLTNNLLSGRWPHPQIVEVQGDTVLKQLVWATAFGDFVSLYLALLNGLNPTPIELIEALKQQLAQ